MCLEDQSDEDLLKEREDLRRELYSLRKSILLVEEELIAVNLEVDKRRKAAKLKEIRFIIDDNQEDSSR